jgi:hypothetical protein
MMIDLSTSQLIQALSNFRLMGGPPLVSLRCDPPNSARRPGTLVQAGR